MRLLVVEDEHRLADTLADILQDHKYLVDVCYDGESGLDNAMSGIYDAVIMDIMMPKMNGFEVVRAMRKAGNATPVLLLTARTDTEDKVTGLDCGADYYLTKPFEMEELLACIRALLRRQGEVVSEELRYGSVILNLNTCILQCEQRSTRLSAKEFEIMRILMSNKENIVPKETLLLKVWGYDSEAEDNLVEVYISFLRKKLDFIKADIRIEVVRRVGYHLGGKEQ
ncbi:MAG: response regulator transcription factor [Oscillospiraceae bacterium]|nr:response regulator transcription factor [Oscillospiraceae bacterium]